MLLFTTLFLGDLWPLTASGAVVEQPDVVAGVGTPSVTGRGAIAEGADIASATGAAYARNRILNALAASRTIRAR